MKENDVGEHIKYVYDNHTMYLYIYTPYFMNLDTSGTTSS